MQNFTFISTFSLLTSAPGAPVNISYKELIPTNNRKTKKSPTVFTLPAKTQTTYKQQSKYSPKHLMLFFYKIPVHSIALSQKGEDTSLCLTSLNSQPIKRKFDLQNQTEIPEHKVYVIEIN